MLLLVHGVKTLYPSTLYTIEGYIFLTIALFWGFVWFSRGKTGWRWVGIVAACSMGIGLIPYERSIPAILSLVLDSDASLSALAEAIPAPFGRILDSVFYPFITSIILLLASVRMKRNVTGGNALEK